MRELKEQLERWARQLGQEELSGDREYRQWKEEQEQLWARFKEDYPKEVRTAHIRIMDLEGVIRSRESCALFWLGLRLGVLVGDTAREE